jgi:ATP synthase protein I
MKKVYHIAAGRETERYYFERTKSRKRGIVMDREDGKKSGIGSGLEALTLVSQLGLTIAIPIVLGAVAGHWIDGKLNTGMVFFLVLVCLGVVGGLAGAYRQVMTLGKRRK